MLIDRRVQKWNMSSEGWEELILDEDVNDCVSDEISAKFANGRSEDEIDLEFLDLKLARYVTQQFMVGKC